MTGDGTADDFPAVDGAAWRQRVEAELKGAPFEELVTELPGGVTIEPLYDADAWDPRTDPAPSPGTPPYRRGGRAAAPELGLPWVIAVPADDPDLSRMHPAIVDDLMGGATGIVVPFDRAGRLGCDPADAADDVARDGLPLHTVGDLDLAFAEVKPALVHWFLDPGGNAGAVAALFDRWLGERGVDPATVRLHLGADPLGALGRDGTLPRGLDGCFDEIAGLVQAAGDGLPLRRIARAADRPYLEAGASPVTAGGLALATAVAHLRALAARGVPPDATARRLHFELAVDRDVFTELARIRALRVVWAKALAALGVPADQMAPAYVHAVVAGRGLTRQDPWVNFLRGTTGTFAAIVGGADAITTPAFDVRLGVSDGLGRRIARNTQSILGEESHLGRVLDPAGGSYALESLTDQLARRMWDVFREVEGQGGMVAAVTGGWVGDRVRSEAGARAAALADGDLPVLGVGVYPPTDEVLPQRPEARTDEIVAAAVRRARDARAAGDALLADLAPPGDGGDAPRVDPPLTPRTDEADVSRSGATAGPASEEVGA